MFVGIQPLFKIAKWQSSPFANIFGPIVIFTSIYFDSTKLLFFQGAITNILEENVVQPLLVSVSAVTLASETVRSILKIDDIVSICRTITFKVAS